MRQLVMCVKKLYSEKKLLKEQVPQFDLCPLTFDLCCRLPSCRQGWRRERKWTQLYKQHPLLPHLPRLSSWQHSLGKQDMKGLVDEPLHYCHCSCSRLVGGVVRGVAWGLSVSLLLLLLLAVLVWLHQHLTPCCHSNGPLTPGGMVWALFEPRITVSHHGNI